MLDLSRQEQSMAESKLDTSFLYEEDSPYEPFWHQTHISEIVPGLFVGDIFAAYDLETLQKHKISAILNLTDQIPCNFPNHFQYKKLPIEDSSKCDISQYFQECCEFIHKHLVEEKTSVFVHCSYGKSRSATIVAAYLMVHQKKTATLALGIIQSKRRQISPNEGCLQALEALDQKFADNDSFRSSCRTCWPTLDLARGWHKYENIARVWRFALSVLQPVHCRSAVLTACDFLGLPPTKWSELVKQVTERSTV